MRYGPMLLRQEVASPHADWSDHLLEVKYNGLRCLVEVADATTIYSRQGNDITDRFPELLEIDSIAERGVYDGEIFFPDPYKGVHDLTAVLRRNSFGAGSKKRMHLALFDVLEIDGEVITDAPLESRGAVLIDAIDDRDVPLVEIATRWPGSDMKILWEATQNHGLEGVVAKRRGSVYRSGQRSDDWKRLKHY